MVLVGSLLVALLDPFFIVPAGAAAWLLCDRKTAYVTVGLIAAVSTMLLASLWAAAPSGLIAIAFLTRFAVGLALVWVIHRLRKPSTPPYT